MEHEKDLAEIVRSHRFSRIRMRIHRILAQRKVMYPTDLAREARVDLRTLWGALDGRAPRFRRERSIFRLGLARRVRGKDGEMVAITERGSRFAGLFAATGWTLERGPRAR